MSSPVVSTTITTMAAMRAQHISVVRITAAGRRPHQPRLWDCGECDGRTAFALPPRKLLAKWRRLLAKAPPRGAVFVLRSSSGSNARRLCLAARIDFLDRVLFSALSGMRVLLSFSLRPFKTMRSSAGDRAGRVGIGSLSSKSSVPNLDDTAFML